MSRIRINGMSRLVTPTIFPPRPIRRNARVLLPFNDLGIKSRNLTFHDLRQAVESHGAAPANLSELMKFAADGLWDGYTEIFGLGQTGREHAYGNTKEYVPFLWGAGSNHHVQAQSTDAIWSPFDRLLVVDPQEGI